MKNIKNKNIGLPPGTITINQETHADYFKITVINYDQKDINELITDNIEDSLHFIEKNNNTWIHIEGIQDISILQQLRDLFNIDDLILEDIASSSQRPKIEEHSDYLFSIIKNLSIHPGTNKLQEEQVSFILGSNYVISIQNSNNDIFGKIFSRIKKQHGNVRNKQIDYLYYCLLDIIVDNFFVIIEEMSEKSEVLENELLDSPNQNVINAIYTLRNQILYLYKSLFPLREFINSIKTQSFQMIKIDTMIFFNDIYDHVLQIIENVQILREIVSNMYDMYLSITSNRMNEIMKILSLIGTIFIPLTFVAGIYGMNFKFMPELEYKFAYPILLVLLAMIGTGMFIYFKRKKWF